MPRESTRTSNRSQKPTTSSSSSSRTTRTGGTSSTKPSNSSTSSNSRTSTRTSTKPSSRKEDSTPTRGSSRSTSNKPSSRDRGGSNNRDSSNNKSSNRSSNGDNSNNRSSNRDKTSRDRGSTRNSSSTRSSNNANKETSRSTNGTSGRTSTSTRSSSRDPPRKSGTSTSSSRRDRDESRSKDPKAGSSSSSTPRSSRRGEDSSRPAKDGSSSGQASSRRSSMSGRDKSHTSSAESKSGRKHWDKEHIVTDLAEEEEETTKNNPPDEIIEDQEDDDDGDDDYEDDFEDYEDDFEDEDEEGDDDDDDNGKMDSGHYDSRTAFERARDERELLEVKRAMARENSATSRHPRSDVGSDDSGHGSSPRNKSSDNNKNKSRFNFASAQERQKTIAAAGRAARRGDKLLTMIRLDVVSFDIFNLPPIRYDAFMRTFGATNSLQAMTQTGDEDLHQDTQTEEIKTLEKWTQCPPAPVTSGELDYDSLKEAIRGVGGQTDKTIQGQSNQGSWEFSEHSNSARLSMFLDRAGPALLTLLEEESAKLRGHADLEGQEQKDVEFSDKVTVLNTDFDFLANRPILDAAFAPDQSAILLTAHGPQESQPDKTKSDNKSPDSYKTTYLCVWNVSHPSTPQKALICQHGQPTSVCFSPLKASMAFSGLDDGAVCAWDLRESTARHQEVAREEDMQWTFRSPTFSTTSPAEINATQQDTSTLAEVSHDSRVTAVRAMPEPGDEDTGGGGGSEGTTAFRLVTAEEKGVLVIWTVLDSRHEPDQHLGLAHWGSVRLVRTLTLDLTTMASSLGQPALGALDVTFDPAPLASSSLSNSLLVASEGGLVLHASAQPDHKPNPRSFKPEFDALATCRSVCHCPYGESYFLAGSDDGSVRLHNLFSERPLITWPGTVDGQPITKVIWSQSRPCVFVVLDNASRIHLWDLGAGDIYPAHTVQFEDEVTTATLNPELGDSRQKQLLALGMASGKVEVHHLKSEYKAEDEEACGKELDRFLHYVSII